VRAVERLVAGLNARDVEVMNEVFVDDSIPSWPLDYDTDTYQVVFIFECRDGRIVREQACWAKPFPAPEWRAR